LTVFDNRREYLGLRGGRKRRRVEKTEKKAPKLLLFTKYY
jgi:hypothetical protein